MIKTTKTLTKYVSDDGSLEAQILKEEDNKIVILFYRDGHLIDSQSYPEHNEIYHEDAAENYVLGIKKI